MYESLLVHIRMVTKKSGNKLAELIYVLHGCERFLKLKYYKNMKCIFKSLHKNVYEQFIKLNYCAFIKSMFDNLCTKVHKQFIKLNYCELRFDKAQFYEQFIKVYYCVFMKHVFDSLRKNLRTINKTQFIANL